MARNQCTTTPFPMERNGSTGRYEARSTVGCAGDSAPCPVGASQVQEPVTSKRSPDIQVQKGVPRCGPFFSASVHFSGR